MHVRTMTRYDSPAVRDIYAVHALARAELSPPTLARLRALGQDERP